MIKINDKAYSLLNSAELAYVCHDVIVEMVNECLSVVNSTGHCPETHRLVNTGIGRSSKYGAVDEVLKNHTELIINYH